jgi:hypothetical protein
MASNRTQVRGKASACTADAAIRIAIAKERVSPSTTPNGRSRPLPTEVESTIGSTGSTHGDTTVASPRRNAKTISKGVTLLFYPLQVKKEVVIVTGV